MVAGRGTSLGIAQGKIVIDMSSLITAKTVVKQAARDMIESAERFAVNWDRSSQRFHANLNSISETLEKTAGNLTTLSAIGGVVAGVGLKSAQNLKTLTATYNALLNSTARAKDQLEEIRAISDEFKLPYLDLVQGAKGFLATINATNVSMRDLVVLAQRLRILAPEKNAQEAAFSLRELLSGDAVSIVENFNLSRTAINRIKNEAQGDPQATLRLLSEYLDSIGATENALRELGESGANAFANLKSAVNEASAAAFDPFLNDVLIPLAEQATDFFRTLQENNPEILQMGAGFAVAAASAAPLMFALSQLIRTYTTLRGLTAGGLNFLNANSSIGQFLNTSITGGAAQSGFRQLAGQIAGTVAPALALAAALAVLQKASDSYADQLSKFQVQLNGAVEATKARLDEMQSGIPPITGAESLPGFVEAQNQRAKDAQMELFNITNQHAQFLKETGEQLGGLVILVDQVAGKFGFGGGYFDRAEASFNERAALARAALADAQGQARSATSGANNMLFGGYDTGQDGEIARTAKAIDEFEQKMPFLTNLIREATGAADAGRGPFAGIADAIEKTNTPLAKLFHILSSSADKAPEAVDAIENVAEKWLDNGKRVATDLMDAMAQGSAAQKQLTELHAAFFDELIRIAQDRTIAAAREQFDLTLARTRTARDFYQQQALAEADFYDARADKIADFEASIQDAEAQAQQQQIRMLADYRREDARRAEDHGKRLAEIQAQTQLNVLNAARRLDARGVLEAYASGTQQLNRETNSFNTERQRRAEDFKLQLADLQTSLKQQQDQRRAAFNAQLADEITQFNQQRERQLAEYDQRLADEDFDRVIRQQRQREDYALQDARRLEDLRRHAAAINAESQLNAVWLQDLANSMKQARALFTETANAVAAQARQIITPKSYDPATGVAQYATGASFVPGGLANLHPGEGVMNRETAAMARRILGSNYTQPQLQQFFAGGGSGGAGGQQIVNRYEFNGNVVLGDIGKRSDEEVVRLVEQGFRELFGKGKA